MAAVCATVAAAAAAAVVGAIVGAALSGGVPCAFCLAMAMPDLAIAAQGFSSRNAGPPTALDAFHSNVKNRLPNANGL